MRQVKLYTLKEATVVVTGDHINFYNYQDRPIHVRGYDEFIIDAPIHIKQVGVDRDYILEMFGDKLGLGDKE